MASWSFRRRIKIIPGVRLNLSKSGISTSIGIRGANLTVGKNGTYLNTGIPGTGIYKRQKISSNPKELNPEIFPNNQESIVTEKRDNIFSVDPENITSQDMQGIKQSIIDAHQQRLDLEEDIKKVKTTLSFSKVKLFLLYLILIGFFAKKTASELKENVKKQREAIQELQEQKENSFVQLDVEFDEELKIKYESIYNKFKDLLNCQKIWDITRAEEQDRVTTRSAASTRIARKQVQFDFKELDDVKYKDKAIYFKNANGADLYFYPTFIVMKGEKDFGVIGLKEIKFEFSNTNFIEEEKVQDDTEIVDYTWLKVNKNGTPDKRFKDNRQIPIVKYGTITLHTETGVNEEYQFSNYEVSRLFAEEFLNFQNFVKEADGEKSK